MSELADQFKGKRSWFEKVVEYIPGFGGYLDRNRRREADKILRDFIVDKFNIEKGNMENLRDTYTDDGNLEALGKIDRSIRLMEQVMDKIRYSDRGYSGFFDEIKINEEELEKMYQYDFSMLENLQEIKTLTVELGQEYSKDKIKVIDNALKTLNTKIDERENILINLSGTA